jgi:hypothetical protein
MEKMEKRCHGERCHSGFFFRKTGCWPAPLLEDSRAAWVVISIMKHARPLVAAIERMVAIAACRSSYGTRRDLILAAHGITGKQKPDGIQQHVKAIGPGVDGR